MPVPKPNAQESHATFVSRCMDNDTMKREFPEQTHRAAVCYASWRSAKKKKAELEGEVVKKDMEIKAIDENTFLVIATDESVDRDGDTVIPEGVDFKNFMANGAFLYGHARENLPVASPLAAAVENKQLLIKGRWADPATSDFHKAIRSLVKQDILKGVSIGFLGKDSEENKDAEGHRIGRKYNKSELIEVSFTPIPSNANAKVIAKDFPDTVQKALFEKTEDQEIEEDAAELQTIFKDLCLSLHIDVLADGTIQPHADNQPDGSLTNPDVDLGPFDPSQYANPEEQLNALLQYAKKLIKLPNGTDSHAADDAKAKEEVLRKAIELIGRLQTVSETKG